MHVRVLTKARIFQAFPLCPVIDSICSSQPPRPRAFRFERSALLHDINVGIQGLTKLLADKAPRSVRQQTLQSYFSRKIAVDASMHIYSVWQREEMLCRVVLHDLMTLIRRMHSGSMSPHTSYPRMQFLIVVGREGDSTLTNEAGETTAHLQGMFYRTVRMLEQGELFHCDGLWLPGQQLSALTCTDAATSDCAPSRTCTQRPCSTCDSSSSYKTMLFPAIKTPLQTNFSALCFSVPNASCVCL